MPAVWTGTISFGLVSIPVRLAPATQDRDVHFRSLHRACLTPLRYLKWCPACNREIPQEEMVLGYEYARGEFLPVEPDELAALSGPHERTVELLDFVNLSEIDPVYFEKTYFVEPGEGASKPYALLQRTLAETGRIGIGRFVLREKERLVAVRTYGEILALDTLYYPDEIRQAPSRPLANLGDRELAIAKSLVDSLTAPFVPERYTSQYRERLQEFLRRKLAGLPQEKRRLAPAAPGQVIDLLEALERSLAAARAARPPAAGGRGNGRDDGRTGGPPELLPTAPGRHS